MAACRTIGLTGSVGCGKTTVLEWLADHGAEVLDADAVVRELLSTDDRLIRAVIRRFGARVRGGDGIDRAALATVVFGDEAALRDLERLVHPVALAAGRRWLADVNADVAALEAVKLVESGLHRELDELWLVVCDPGVRDQRLVSRRWSRDEIARRVAASPSNEAKLALADVIIDNSGSREATYRQLDAAFSQRGRGRAAACRAGRHEGV